MLGVDDLVAASLAGLAPGLPEYNPEPIT